MRFKEISESTTSGSIAPTEHAFVKMQTRNPSVYGDQKVGSLFKGKKTNKPFVNSLNEGAIKQLSMDLKELKDEEFKKKYNKTKQEARAAMKAKPEPVNEADLQEDDIIVVPGQGRLKKTGFVKHDPDRAEREGETLKNSLHTIIRVASELDKQLSTQDNFPEWVSEKVGTVKSMMVTVADYLTSSKEMQHDPDAMDEAQAPISAGRRAGKAGKPLAPPHPKGSKEYSEFEKGWNEKEDIRKKNKLAPYDKLDEISQDTAVSYAGKRMNTDTTDKSPAKIDKMIKGLKGAVARAHGEKPTSPAKKQQGVGEGAKVDRMVKHVAQSEKKLGHGKKEAENIAWATANKRGMLNNKNKKA